MVFFKIAGKSTNLNLRFEQPLMLKSDKQYKLGFVKMSLNDISVKSKLSFKFQYQMEIGGKTLNSKLLEINGWYSVETIKEYFLENMKEVVDIIINSFRKSQSEVPKWIDEFDYSKFKIDINWVAPQVYSLNFQTPLQIKISDCGNFCDMFGFKMNDLIMKKTFLPNQLYISSSNPKILKPLHLIEVHTNITEFSYSNHDTNPHVHNTHELLYPFFIDKILLPNDEYNEVPNNVIYIPLRNDLRSICNIKVTITVLPSVIVDIENVVLYLHLIEE